jgi:ribosomal protein S18 acetylase RimI-like enzyme
MDDRSGDSRSSVVTVRAATDADLPTIAALHRAAFPQHFMTSLGLGFLAEYYHHVLDHSGNIAFVAVADDQCVGFVVGFAEPSAFYRSLRRRALPISRHVFTTVVRRPRIPMAMVRRLRRSEGLGAAQPVGFGELSSIAVDPRSSGQGVGSGLLAEFVEQAKANGWSGVYLRTDGVNNDGAIRLYAQAGFSQTSTVTMPGDRRMIEFEIRLDAR